MEKVYSLRHLGFFVKPFLTIKKDGFYYKGKRYTHEDIKQVNVSGGGGKPCRIGVKLKDSKLILVNASILELNGAKAKTGFFSGNNEIFEELKSYFEIT